MSKDSNFTIEDPSEKLGKEQYIQTEIDELIEWLENNTELNEEEKSIMEKVLEYLSNFEGIDISSRELLRKCQIHIDRSVKKSASTLTHFSFLIDKLNRLIKSSPYAEDFCIERIQRRYRLVNINNQTSHAFIGIEVYGNHNPKELLLELQKFSKSFKEWGENVDIEVCGLATGQYNILCHISSSLPDFMKTLLRFQNGFHDWIEKIDEPKDFKIKISVFPLYPETTWKDKNNPNTKPLPFIP